MAEKMAVIYARYSSDKQTYQSIEGQIKICKKFSDDNGYTILREYIDEAQTGKNDNRKGFQLMMKDSKKKLFDTVIVYAFDRFGRSILQSLTNEQILVDNGVTVLSATENNEDTPSGRLQRTIHMGFAQYVSEELAQKVARGMVINAEKGLSNGGHVPFGYKLEKINPYEDRSKKKFVVNEATSPIVVEIFTKYADGWSMKKICESLNERQIKSAKNTEFNNSLLHTLLKNRRYLGLYIYGDVEIECDEMRIIDEDLFNRVQEKMIANKKAPARARAKIEYLLTTKLFCGHCKAMMTGHSSNQVSKKGIIFNYYRCKNQGGGKPCKKKMVQKDFIEDKVIEVCRRQLTAQNIRRIAKEIVKIAKSLDDRTMINRLERRLKIVQDEKENQMATLRSCKDDIVKEMIIEDLSKIGADIMELERQLAVENARRENITEGEIVRSLTKLADGDVNDMTYRRSLIRLLVNKIFLYDDNFIITINTGDDVVDITIDLLGNIENALKDNSLCLLTDSFIQFIASISMRIITASN